MNFNPGVFDITSRKGSLFLTTFWKKKFQSSRLKSLIAFKWQDWSIGGAIFLCSSNSFMSSVYCWRCHLMRRLLLFLSTTLVGRFALFDWRNPTLVVSYQQRGTFIVVPKCSGFHAQFCHYCCGMNREFYRSNGLCPSCSSPLPSSSVRCSSSVLSSSVLYCWRRRLMCRSLLFSSTTLVGIERVKVIEGAAEHRRWVETAVSQQ